MFFVRYVTNEYHHILKHIYESFQSEAIVFMLEWALLLNFPREENFHNRRHITRRDFERSLKAFFKFAY